MHRHLARTLTALTLVGAMLGIVAPAAQAAVVPVNMTFTADGPAIQGDTVTLGGRIWVQNTGNRSRVEFYFQRRGTTPWVYAGFVNSTDRGHFVKRTTARFTGTWKAVYRGTAARRGTLRVADLRVSRAVPNLLAIYRGTETNWQGPAVRLPNAAYRAQITYSCTGTGGGYMYFHWNGADFGYESVGSNKASGTLTLNGHKGARSGYFDVSTWIDCTWSARIYSGVSLVMV